MPQLYAILVAGVVMILGSSLEFEKGHNNEISSRETDNEEIPMVSEAQLLEIFFSQEVLTIISNTCVSIC